MKNKLIRNRKIQGNIYTAIVELIPENEIEKIALKNFNNSEVNDEERQLIEYYLAFNLNNFGNYSFISIINQEHNLYTIEILVN